MQEGDRYLVEGVPLEGEAYLLVKAELDYTLVNGYVINTAISTWTIVVAESITPDDATEGIFYRCIARYDDGKKLDQPVRHSLEIFCIDDGTGTAKGLARWGISG